jgi:trk system potassium uptake protein TrkH
MVQTNFPGVTRRLFSRLTPGQVVALSFAATILIGSVLLTLPIASRQGRLPYLDALFTATSAVCVTGLVVVDTYTQFSAFGQVVVLSLIQIGGLGLMTMATILFIAARRRIGLRGRFIIAEAFNQDTVGGMVKLTKMIGLTTAVVELTGATLLATRFVPQFGPVKGAWYGVFHAVSAFNNAGFDLMGGFRNLTGYVGDPLVSLVVAGLIIIGGLGFSVINELRRYPVTRHLSLHTRLVVRITALLLVGGTVLVLWLEFGNTLAQYPWGTKVLASFFTSVTPRTAGFNTLASEALAPSTALVVILLMFIGASPGSTGGGVKTSTIGILFAWMRSEIMGQDDTVILNRRLPRDVIHKALVIVSLAVLLVLTAIFILCLTEKAAFLDICFEVVSAFGTVGLSRALTPTLSSMGKIVIILTMFSGRVGPLGLATALTAKLASSTSNIHLPEERVSVG